MIFLLYGQDTYSLKEKLREMVSNYQEANKRGLDLKYLKISDFSEILNENQQNSIFNEKKLIVVSNSFSGKPFRDSFIKNYKVLVEGKNIIIFIEEGKLAANDAVLKIFKKYAKSQEFPLLSGEKLRKWAKERILSFNKEISLQALNRLLESCAGDLWLLENEIKKIAAYKTEKTIEEKDVLLLVKGRIETDIFKTIDAIASKNKRVALSLIHNHIEKGDAPLYLLSMINFQFRNLLIVKDLAEKGFPYSVLSRLSGLHPFVVKKSYISAQRFSFLELKKIYHKMFEVDFSIKTGKLKPEEALDIFISEI